MLVSRVGFQKTIKLLLQDPGQDVAPTQYHPDPVSILCLSVFPTIIPGNKAPLSFCLMQEYFLFLQQICPISPQSFACVWARSVVVKELEEERSPTCYLSTVPPNPIPTTPLGLLYWGIECSCLICTWVCL